MQTVHVKDGSANPAPLGLLAFGMTTVLLNLHNAGLFAFDWMILSMGIFYGGLAQVIAGIMEWKKGNSFGATAFTSFGMFWLSLAGLQVLGRSGSFPAPDEVSMAAYFCVWGLFTLVLFIGTFRLSRPLQVVFGSLAVLFFLLVAKEAAGKTDVGATIGVIAGFEGIFCGLSAMYAGLSQVLRELFAPATAEEAAQISPEALSREIVDQLKAHLDKALATEGLGSRDVSVVAEEAAKAAVKRMLPSIVAYVKKSMGGA
jgi:Predicted membrane protein